MLVLGARCRIPATSCEISRNSSSARTCAVASSRGVFEQSRPRVLSTRRTRRSSPLQVFGSASEHSPSSFGDAYRRDGVAFGPQIIPAPMIAAARAGCEEVMAGIYATGVAPVEMNYTGDPEQLRKIDNVHMSNDAVRELVTYPPLGEFLAGALGVERIQCWMVQLLHKPAPRGGRAGAPQHSTAVGWHQDWHYWTEWWTEDSEIATVWIALTDVKDDSGPLAFYAGSHAAGYLEEGADFFGDTSAQQLQAMAQGLHASHAHLLAQPPVQGILAPGSFSVHHRLTVHGSRPNASAAPRTAIAVHFVTDKCTPLAGYDMNSEINQQILEGMLGNPKECPMMWEGSHVLSMSST